MNDTPSIDPETQTLVDRIYEPRINKRWWSGIYLDPEDETNYGIRSHLTAGALILWLVTCVRVHGHLMFHIPFTHWWWAL